MKVPPQLWLRETQMLRPTSTPPAPSGSLPCQLLPAITTKGCLPGADASKLGSTPPLYCSSHDSAEGEDGPQGLLQP